MGVFIDSRVIFHKLFDFPIFKFKEFHIGKITTVSPTLRSLSRNFVSFAFVEFPFTG